MNMLNCSEDNDNSCDNEPSTTTSDKRRRKQFSVQEKKKILDEIDKGIKKCIIAKKYHISSSTLSTFIKYREKIEKSSSPFVDPFRKRVHAAQLSNIERSSKIVCEESNARLHKIKNYSSSLKTSESSHSESDLHVAPLSQSETTEDKESLDSDDSSELKRHKVKRRRKQFSFQEKKIILEALDSGVDPKQIAREYGIKGSTIFTFIRCKKQIEENITKREAQLKTKRLRPSPFEAIDKAVYEWILQSNCESFPVNSKLRKLALSFANSLGITNFKGSIGWLYRFKYHYGNNLRMKSIRDDDTGSVKEDNVGTDMILRSREKSKKKSSARTKTSSQNTMNKIKCPCDNESQKDNIKTHFRRRKEKHKKEKKTKREKKVSILVDDKCATSKIKNVEMSECCGRKHGNLEVAEKEVMGKNAPEQLEDTELNESHTCDLMHSEMNQIKKSAEGPKDTHENIECADTTHKKPICNSSKEMKEDSSIPFIVSASEAVSMACKLRQFIMAHKDIPNYVQDSCDIICDYTERCVQQEKLKNPLMCSKT